MPSHAQAVQATSCAHQSRRPLSAGAAGCQRSEPLAWEKTPRGHVREMVIGGQASTERAGEPTATSARSWGCGHPSEAPRATPRAGGGGRRIPPNWTGKQLTKGLRTRTTEPKKKERELCSGRHSNSQARAAATDFHFPFLPPHPRWPWWPWWPSLPRAWQVPPGASHTAVPWAQHHLADGCQEVGPTAHPQVSPPMGPVPTLALLFPMSSFEPH